MKRLYENPTAEIIDGVSESIDMHQSSTRKDKVELTFDENLKCAIDWLEFQIYHGDSNIIEVNRRCLEELYETLKVMQEKLQA